jgi:outer membrane protein OmpA-like peptidoglycan-associated protein
MKTWRAARRARCVAAFGLTVSTAACGLLPAPSGTAVGRPLTLPYVRPSVLVIIVDRISPAVVQLTSTLLTQSARAEERVIIFDERNGALLASSVAPAAPGQAAPEPPVPLPAHPTTFQEARYQKAIRAYRERLTEAWQTLRRRTRAGLVTWARQLTARVGTIARQPASDSAGLSAALGQTAATLASLRQSGNGSGIPATIAIIGGGPTLASATPTVPASLAGSTVVVAGFQGTRNQEAAWQADLDQAGAVRAVVLTPATSNQLSTVVQQGLDGAVTDTLTSVLFGPGQYTLTAAALPQLRTLLHLMTVTYTGSTASIDGYTDDRPVTGGNMQLSQRRAQTVLNWLVANHVAASRLQAAGYGDTDPVAPNTPSGQPLNRRVVVVIDPGDGQPGP